MTDLHNQDAERYCIGAMLIHNDSVEAISAIVHPNDFTSQVCRDLFFIIMSVRASGEPVDVLSLAAKRETLSGGQPTVYEAASIQREAASYKSAQINAQEVRRLSQLRQLTASLTASLTAITKKTDPIDMINTCQQDLVRVSEISSPIDVRTVADHMPTLINDIQARMDAGGKVSGLMTGYPDLDAIICGMRGGHMVVIAGRPGTGKTTLAMNIAENAAAHGTRSLVFSLEMSSLELTRRMLSSVGRIPLSAIDSGKVENHTQNLTVGVTKIKEMPVYVCDKGGLGISQIRMIARFQKRMNKIDCIVLDYIGLVRTSSTKNSTRSQELGEISRQCKEMAKELDIPVIVLAQLNREIDKSDRDPRLSDLRDSGEIEQDADVVAFVTKTPDEGVTKVVVAKHRHSKTGDCRLLHRGELSRFDSMVAGYTPPTPKQSSRDY